MVRQNIPFEDFFAISKCEERTWHKNGGIISMYRLSGFADEIDASLDKQIEVLKKLGMEWIECRGVDGNPLISYSIEEAEKIKKKLDDASIHLSSVGSSIGKIGINHDFEPHFKLFVHTCDIAKLFETKNIRIFSFFIPEGEDADKYESEVMRRLERLVEYASKHDLVLLHENEKEIYGDIASRCLKIMKRFYSDNFKAIFDFANFVQCHQNTLEAWDMLKDYIAYVHIKDAIWDDGSVVPPGHGDGHLQEILSSLHQNGYDGFLSLEPHLADFQGFNALENGNIKREQKLTGEEAFTLSHDSLLAVLERIGWN